MRAVSQDVLGGPDVLRVVTMDRPRARPNEMVVGVRAAGLNPTDWKHRAHRIFLREPPFVLGWDVSGVVEEIGYGVTAFRPGDDVFGMLPYPFGHGAHAEYVAAPARVFVHKPSAISHTEAGALPLVSLTAWQALVENAKLCTGQRVLVHAAAGGVGHVAVQVAKSRGAHVIGTASVEKHEFLADLGVDELIDYRTHDFTDVVGDIDVVLDTVGGDVSTRSLQVLRPGGIMVSLLARSRGSLAAEADRRGVRAIGMLADADRGGMLAVAQLVESGLLRPTITRAFPLAAAAEAHAAGESGRTTGKIVLVME
jgi:NADPH:quinone reductase-like Zn-dependent oxidoreductase